MPNDQMGSVFGAQNLPFWVQGGLANPSTLPMDMQIPRQRRMQENRPEQWGPEIPPENLLGLIPGGMAGRLVAAAPRAATGLLAGYYGMSGTDPAGGAPRSAPAQSGDPAILEQQKKLFEAGFLRREDIDGVRGNKTVEAEKAFNAAQQQQQQLQMQQQSIQAQQQAAAAQQAQAQAQQAQALQQAEADRIRNEQREQGQQRYNEAEASISPVSRAIRDYAGPLGITAGLVMGPALRKMVTSGSDYLSQRAANTAANLQKRWPSTPTGQVARVNEIWRQGGQGGAVPFTSTPNTAPGFAANAGAASVDKLFKPSAAGQIAADVTPMAVFGGEYAGASHFLHGAEDELVKATEAASADPSDINIARMQKAKDNVALYTGFVRAGQAGGSSYAGAWAKMGRKPTTPNLSKAETEKLNLEEMLRGGQSAAPATSPVARALAAQPPMPGKRPPWMRADNENALIDPLDFGYKR